MIKKFIFGLALIMASSTSFAAKYDFDIEGQHAFIHFKIQHLGFSWLLGDFKKFNGHFNYDEANKSASDVHVVIETASIDSNHAARDKHLRDEDFLNVKKHPKATFDSTFYSENADGSGTLKGKFTLNGVTRDIAIKTQKVGGGDSPWGDYRVGFSGEVALRLKDYNIKRNLGPASEVVYLELHVEGIRAK